MPPRLKIGMQPPQPEPSEPIEQRPTLWSRAPAWRKLVIGSGVLTSLAVSAPILLPRPDTAQNIQSARSPTQSELKQLNCTSPIPDAPDQVMARVTCFVPSEEVLTITRMVEAQIGAQISPAYLPLKRVGIQPLPSGLPTIAALPVNMTVKIGDLVEVSTRYRDRSLPCHFFPWTVNHVIGDKLH